MLAFSQTDGAKVSAMLAARDGGYSAVSSLKNLSPTFAPATQVWDPGGCEHAMLSKVAHNAQLL